MCDELAASPLGLCGAHERGYIRAGRPGGAKTPKNFFATYERRDRPVPVTCEDEVAFRAWCRAQLPAHRTGTINLRGLRALLRAELQSGMYVHGLQPVAVWHLTWVQSLADECQRRDVASLAGLDASVFRRAYHQRMVQETQQALRKIYFTPSDTQDAGYIETEHFGVRFPHRSSYVELTCISQRWLRDLLWDHIADVLRSPTCPRRAQPVDFVRRAGAELSAFIEAEAPGGGHDPTVLRGERIRRFVADLRNRGRLGLAFRGQARLDGKRAKVTENSRRMVFNYGGSLLRSALDSGSTERIGLDRAFIAAMPVGGPGTPRSRNPFPDEVAGACGRGQPAAARRRLRPARPGPEGHVGDHHRHRPARQRGHPAPAGLRWPYPRPSPGPTRRTPPQDPGLLRRPARRPPAHRCRARPPGAVPHRHPQPRRPPRAVLHLVPHRLP